jgi:hypothetical protein
MNLINIYLKNRTISCKELKVGDKLRIIKHKSVSSLMNSMSFIPIGEIIEVSMIHTDNKFCSGCKSNMCIRTKCTQWNKDYAYYATLCCYETETLEGRRVI